MPAYHEPGRAQAPRKPKRRRRWGHIILTGVLVLLIAVPTTLALLRAGFGMAVAKPESLGVWSVNEARQLIGRVDTAPGEITTGFGTASNRITLLQRGDDLIVHDDGRGTLERMDVATARPREAALIPKGVDVARGGDSVVALERATGRVWALDAGKPLRFDAKTSAPFADLGRNARIAVGDDGAMYAWSPAAGAITRLRTPTAVAEQIPVTAGTLGAETELTVVGERPVLFDRPQNLLVVDGSMAIAPAENGLHVQEPGPKADGVLLATADKVLTIPFQTTKNRVSGQGLSAGGSGSDRDAPTDPRSVARPVSVNSCTFGAWGQRGRVAYQCTGQQAVQRSIPDALEGGELVWRVNGGRVLLNNTRNGKVYEPREQMRRVDNWDGVARIAEERNPERPLPAEELPKPDALAAVLANRTQQNHAPEPANDVAGVRPGERTLVEVLANDRDSDGDVLRVTDLEKLPPAEFGSVHIVDDGRAIQIDAAPSAQGPVSFDYVASDGRPGGVVRASVFVRVSQPGENSAPRLECRDSLPVELGATTSMNVLPSWSDPDGDPLVLASAAAPDGATVRFGADGVIAVSVTGGNPGIRMVPYTVSDGDRTTRGALALDVRAQGSLAPIAEPDAITGVLGQTLTVRPLANDQSPSGAPLSLQGAKTLDGAPGGLEVDTVHGEVRMRAAATGVYFVQYELAAQGRTSRGLIRFDVLDPAPRGSAAPLAAIDEAVLSPGGTINVDVTANDRSPSGDVLFVTGLDAAAVEAARTDGVAVQLIDHRIIRVSASGGLSRRILIPYQVSDDGPVANASLLVAPAGAGTLTTAVVARDDEVRVRPGGTVSVPVLDNDAHGPGDELTPALELGEFPGGAAAVSGDRVLLTAPGTPGESRITYRVRDRNGALIPGTVHVRTVDPASPNHAPAPALISATAIAGQPVRIDVVNRALDPDGDQVHVRSITDAPKHSEATIVEGGEALVVTPAGDAAGTDSLQVELDDGRGARATATIRIGTVPAADVAARNEDGASPGLSAADDTVRVRPGATVSIPVLANDATATGESLALDGEATAARLAAEAARQGVGADIDGDAIRVTVGADTRIVNLPYTLRSADGATASATVHIVVDAQAPAMAPSARPLRALDRATADGGGWIEVDPRAGAVNPSGASTQLEVALVEDRAAPATSRCARSTPGGRVALRADREGCTAIVRLTDPATTRSTASVLRVPRAAA